MATSETVDMGPPHEPKEESIKAFEAIEVDLKKMLQHKRHEANKHEPEYFAAVKFFDDEQLTSFSSKDLKEVRVATSAYGKHLFGKVNLPNSTSYFMFRAFVPGGPETAKLHCIHMAEIEGKDGEKSFKAIWGPHDKLEWFDE